MVGKQPKRKPRPGVDEYGRTELHYAARDGDAARVRALLTAGSDANAADDNGWTALHFACQAGSAPVVRQLLEAGAAVSPRDSHGNTPLSTGVFNSRGKGEVIKLLRTAGADPYAQNAHGVSPVSLARTIANYDVRQFFGDLPAETSA